MKLSNPQLLTAVATYVAANKIANSTYNITRDNIVGLLDKIAKVFTLDTEYVDKLARFDGESFTLAKDIEEWQQDLIMPSSYDSTGAGALSPSDPTYRPPFYSKSLGKMVFKTTIRNNNIERAVNNVEEFNSIIATQSKRLFDSEALWRYAQKREIIAKMVAEAESTISSSSQFDASSDYSVGAYVYSGTSYGIVVKPYSADAESSWAGAVASGYVVVYDLISEIAVPTDTATSEAFIKQLKKDKEVAEDYSEGHSLSGNTLGASGNLVLLVKQGVMPTLEVDAMAGAFQLSKIAVPVDVIVVKDFGSNATGVYAVLCDARSVKLHNTYRAVRENMNGDGDFLNLFLHTENTAHYSKNTFLKVYKPE